MKRPKGEGGEVDRPRAHPARAERFPLRGGESPCCLKGLRRPDCRQPPLPGACRRRGQGLCLQSICKGLRSLYRYMYPIGSVVRPPSLMPRRYQCLVKSAQGVVEGRIIQGKLSYSLSIQRKVIVIAQNPLTLIHLRLTSVAGALANPTFSPPPRGTTEE